MLARIRPRAAVLLVLAGAPLFGCGVDREAFVREANASCCEYRAELASASTETWEVWPRALARHIETLRTLEDPTRLARELGLRDCDRALS